MTRWIPLTLLAAFCAATPVIAEENPSIGVVNYSNCATESKLGKKEMKQRETIQNQLVALVKETEDELKDLHAKLEDSEYLETLSEKAKEELRSKKLAKQEEFGHLQQNFYQSMQQNNYQIAQKVAQQVMTAAKKIAEEKGLDYLLNQEACFYTKDSLDLTNLVVEEMDKSFEQTLKAQETAENVSE